MRRNEVVVKAEIRLTILLPAKSVEDAAATLGQCDLGDIYFEITDGQWLGNIELIKTERVLPWNLSAECVALDGPTDFFGDNDG